MLVTTMRRVVAVLALLLVLDVLALDGLATVPRPQCETDQVLGASCVAVTKLAMGALPLGHPSITNIEVTVPIVCEGYCPLLTGPLPAAVVMFYFGDAIRPGRRTRTRVDVHLAAGRLVASFQFSERINGGGFPISGT